MYISHIHIYTSISLGPRPLSLTHAQFHVRPLDPKNRACVGGEAGNRAIFPSECMQKRRGRGGTRRLVCLTCHVVPQQQILKNDAWLCILYTHVGGWQTLLYTQALAFMLVYPQEAQCIYTCIRRCPQQTDQVYIRLSAYAHEAISESKPWHPIPANHQHTLNFLVQKFKFDRQSLKSNVSIYSCVGKQWVSVD